LTTSEAEPLLPLNYGKAWRQIELENPGLSVQSAAVLGEGWNSRVYLVNNELVFRFPKRSEQWGELDREIKFLAFAADRLPLAVPRYLQVVRESSAAEFGYAVYRYLRGRALNVSAGPQSQRVAEAARIGGFLRVLHGLKPHPDIASILPREDQRGIAEQYYARAERDVIPRLTPSEAKVLQKQFEMYLSTPGNFRFPPVVLHADLGKDHIVVEDGLVSGVLDFGDVNWGDPDYDFMYLFVDFGVDFAIEVARRYGHPNLDQLRIKLCYFGILDQIGTILDGAGRALEGQETAAWHRLQQLLRSE